MTQDTANVILLSLVFVAWLLLTAILPKAIRDWAFDTGELLVALLFWLAGAVLFGLFAWGFLMR